MEIIDGHLYITYTDAPNSPVDLGKIYDIAEGTDGLDFYPLPDGTYGVTVGKAQYLENIVIPAAYNGKAVTQILPSGFSGSKIKSITIPDSVNLIGDSAFSNCVELEQITIPTSVTEIGDSAFSNCIELEQITIPTSVTEISSGAFYHCTKLTKIELPDKVQTVGAGAFESCYSLEEVTLPSGLTSIENNTFAYCESLEEITVPASVTEIGNGAFYYCINLEKMKLPNGIKSLGDGAFDSCESLSEMVIPNSVESMGWGVFNSCAGLNSITLPFTGNSRSGEITSQFNYIFGGMAGNYYGMTVPESLKTVTISENITNLGNYAFAGCYGITEINIPSSVTSIGHHAFDGCNSLEDITLSDNVYSIGGYAFANCSSLTEFTFPSRIYGISTGMFSGCTNLSKLNLNATIVEIGARAFENCVSLGSFIYDVTVPEMSIGNRAFSGCTSLKTLQFNGITTEIGGSAFAGCDKLESVYFNSYEDTVIAADAFANCDNLATVYIRAISEIKYGTFAGLPKLKELYYLNTKEAWSNVKKENGWCNDGMIIHCADGDITYINEIHVGEIFGVTFEDALTQAELAYQPITVYIHEDVNMTRQFNPQHGYNITFEGVPSNGVYPKISIASDAVNTNKFRLQGCADYTFKNLTIVNENARGCLIQLNHENGGDLFIENCNITSADQWSMINCLTTNGTNQRITVKNSTLTQTAGSTGLIRSGNSNDHYTNLIINIENSRINAYNYGIEINSGSTAQITIKKSQLVGSTQDIIKLANPENLKGESAEVGKTTVKIDEESTLTPAEGKLAIKYDDTCPNIIIDWACPDDIVAQMYVEGSVSPVNITRRDFAQQFSENSVGDTSYILNILKDVNVGDAELRFNVDEGKTITINGDLDGDGINAVITGSNSGNPTIRVFGPGKVIFNNIDYVKTKGQMLQMYNTVDFEMIGCNWTATERGVFAPSNPYDSIVTVKNSTITAENGGYIIFTSWASSAITFNFEEGTVLTADTVIQQNAKSENVVMNVNGATVNGDLDIDAGKVNLNSGTWIGKITASDGVVTKADSFVIIDPDSILAAVTDSNGAVKATLTDVANLHNFFNQAGDGDTIKLYQDITVANNSGYNVRGSVTIDGNGKTITYVGSGDNADMFFFKNTEFEYDATSVTEVPADKMDTVVIKNLKFVSTESGGAFRYYNVNIVLEEGNDIDVSNGTRQLCWNASRQLGSVTVNGGKYTSKGSYMFGIAPSGKLTVNGGEFISTGGAGIFNISGGVGHVINGGTFTVSGVEENSANKLISVKNASLTIKGGTFTCENPLVYVLALRAAATTVTINGAAVEMYGNVRFESNDNVLNLTEGKLEGTLVFENDVAPTVNKSNSFLLIEQDS